MYILAFESTAKAASIAVCKDERCLGVYTVDNGLTQSDLLLPMAQDMLKSLKLSFSDIDLLACTVGPGSFTGVRIGVSLVKGIAFMHGIPTVGVSTLDSLAENLSGTRGIIVSAMDARRNQLYAAIYRCDGERTEKLTSDLAVSAAELALMMKEYDGERIYIVGDGAKIAKKHLFEDGIKTEKVPPLIQNQNAYSCAVIALKKYRSGDFCPDISLEPLYLRMPQAERERLERMEKGISESK